MNVQRPLETGDGRQASLEVLTAHAWNRVRQAINAIASHQPESDEDFDRADPKALAAALSVVRWYQSKSPDSVPDDVFAMPDGGLMFEWGNPCGTVRRLDFAPGGKCQLVITYADGRPAEFVEVVLGHDNHSTACTQKSKPEWRWPNYSLAP